MRHEPSFLKDILSACRKIEAIVAATDEDSFLKGEILPAAILHHLTVIGEAISRLSVDLRERHPQVPWDGMGGPQESGFRAFLKRSTHKSSHSVH